MSLKAIDTICQAEEAAAKLKAEAIANAKHAVSTAEEDGRLALARLEDSVSAELKAKREDALSKAKAEIEAIVEETAKETAVLREKAEAQLDIVAEYIAERIVNG